MPYNPVTLKPSSGGDLVTDTSIDMVGATNYMVKRDFRRHMDREVRREGDVLFAPNTDAVGDQPYPNTPDTDEAITLVHLARRPNGKTAVIVATPTTIYRYFALENGPVYEDGVYEDGVFATESGDWLIIGSGFSPSGHRWEAKNLNGYTIFNNGYDLPVSYRVEDFVVRPLYELREAGVAAVGTIEESNALMNFADISEISPDVLPTLLSNVTPPSGYTVSQASLVVTASGGSGTVFTPDMVGLRIFLPSGVYRRILSYVSPTVVNVESGSDFSGLAFTLENPASFASYTDESNLSRIQYRLIWSGIGEPLRWAATGVASIIAGSNVLTLSYPMRSIKSGDSVLVVGAGVSGGNLTAGVAYAQASGMSFVLDATASTTVTDAAISKSDIESLFTGYQDIQDDSSSILRLSTLQNRLIVFKDTAIFVGQFTGSIDGPWDFTRVYQGSKTPFWRWTVASVLGQSLLYAGRNGFYTFDLTRQIPLEHPKLTFCKNTFFDNVTAANLESIYAAENAITNEIWFVFPSSVADKGIAFDYLYNTCSTLGAYYTAAATVKQPIVGVQIGPSTDWFVMGTSTGTVLLYGATDTGSSIWTRNDVAYDSILTSGFTSFGDDFNEKDLRSYVLILAPVSGGNAPVQIKISTARNPSETATLRLTKTLATPDTKNLISTFYRGDYFQDTVSVLSQTKDLQLVARILEPAGIESKSTIRRETDN